ncbi:helix-turn-helix domain-containing protein [Lentzea flaviverrucosa]|uniref:DNA binding domain-containing protein, excisionase family n=1 Tax=Lentzea flaviverrucosa TaxID=200379 RepID=A0A1H9N0J4_9PSEU|nr:helix-turn-helix domain-containing protein [Lentzea flaviverrucosa]RDI30719.1 excisionase family DNA binding protein [Lentzea flaviverrucosa]SER29185.1 DNA binding domain-containing protein, excisionase family [Lentzea flaviverrucosa]
MSAALQPVQPDSEDIVTADAALPTVKAYLNLHRENDDLVRVRVEEDGEVLTLPRAAVEVFTQVLAYMAAGHGVVVVPVDAELTTQQAADLLNVSRPYLIGLLEAGVIEYRKVGKHRRIKAVSLTEYLRNDDQRRRQAADELSALTQEMGLA